jgi:hypothetical protein
MHAICAVQTELFSEICSEMGKKGGQKESKKRRSEKLIIKEKRKAKRKKKHYRKGKNVEMIEKRVNITEYKDEHTNKYINTNKHK